MSRYFGSVNFLGVGLSLQRPRERKMESDSSQALGFLVPNRQAEVLVHLLRRVGCIPWPVLGSGKNAKHKTKKQKSEETGRLLPALSRKESHRVEHISILFLPLVMLFLTLTTMCWNRPSSSTAVSLSLIPFLAACEIKQHTVTLGRTSIPSYFKL